MLRVWSLFQVNFDCRNLSITAGRIREKEQTRRHQLSPPHENAWPGSRFSNLPRFFPFCYMPPLTQVFYDFVCRFGELMVSFPGQEKKWVENIAKVNSVNKLAS